MRVVITRPQFDGEQTATALRKRGHEVLVAPLMRIEPIAAHLGGEWDAVIVTSANAPNAIADNSARNALIKLPLFAVGQRSGEAARQTGFKDVVSANGDVRDLVRLIATRRGGRNEPLLYLAGEDRARDLLGELSARGIAAEMRVVYRAVSVAFPPALIEALEAGEVDIVMHFSRRSADNYVAGAKTAGIGGPALAVRHFCLSAQVAEPFLNGDIVANVAIAARPDEAALIELLKAPPA
jgi:uroporphyrinogen-III synthase